MPTAEIAVCGAGIAGAAAAYHLAVRHRVPNVVLIDELAPMSLTSSRGTQGYRNWFDGPDDTMTRFVDRSITLLEGIAEESGNAIGLSRRGYLFVTGDPARREGMRAEATRVCGYGAGPMREHPGPAAYAPPTDHWRAAPSGADVVLDPALLRQRYPFFTEEAVAALHVRRAGWLDAPALGQWLIAAAERAGTRVLRDRVDGVATSGGRVTAVTLASGGRIDTERYVIADGPLLPKALRMIDVELPVFHELHAKMRFPDRLGVIPRSLPFTIWTDPIDALPWSDAERQRFAAREETRWLLGAFPGGAHVRPVKTDGRDETDVFIIWTFESGPHDYVWPPTFGDYYAEVLLRGLARYVPTATAYFGEGHRGYVDGAYYTKTPENRPLIGPLALEGAFVIGALSGYGIMASQAAAELLAAHVMGERLPTYAANLSPARYDDPARRAALERFDARVGQL